MSTSSFSALPLAVQRIVTTGLEGEIDQIRGRIRAEEQASAPNREAIEAWQNDIKRVDELLGSFQVSSGAHRR